MKIFDRYETILAANDEYISPQNSSHVGLLGSTFQFYSRVVKVVLYSNKMVKKNIYNDFNWVGSSLDLFFGFERAGIKYEIKGMSNITKHEGPVLFIGNHMSTLETLTLPAVIHPVKKIVFITKKELTDYPFFGPINSARDPIIVGRENPREDLKIVIEEGRKRIEAGKSIVIFPQKTRSKYFDVKGFNSLGVKLAKQNNVPVVPFALLTDAWDNGKYIKEAGSIDTSKKVRFKFGEPFTVDDRGAESHQRIIDFITSRLTEWGRKDYIKS